jgi:hypothetical protein
LPSARRFAECFLSGTRQSPTLGNDYVYREQDSRHRRTFGNDPVHMLARVCYPNQSPPPTCVLLKAEHICVVIISGHPGNKMGVYMKHLIDELVRAWEEGCGRMTELRRQTSKCMFGTSTPCMTYWRMGYSAPCVFTVSSHAQFARKLLGSFG